VTLTPERAFLGLALALGGAIAAVLPPTGAPDEGAHLGRVFALAEGDWGVGGEGRPSPTFPRSIAELHLLVTPEGAFPPRPPRRSLEQWSALLRRPLEPERRVGLRQGGAHPPVVYLPALPGVWLGSALGLPPAGLVWLGRAGSLAAWIALVWVAIRICPLRRWTLAALALTPMSLAAAASVSADGWTNGAALLFLACAMRAAFGGSHPLPRRELAALVGAALAVGLGKSGTQPLAALVLAIPPARVGGGARLAALAAAVALAMVVPAAAWLAVVQAAAPPPVGPDVDPAAQLRHVLADPLGFVRVLGASFAKNAGVWAVSFLGVLGPFTVSLPAGVYAAWAGALALVTAADGPQPATLGAGRRGLLVAVFVACLLGSLTIAYLAWNPVGAPHVIGVQGRYFLPIAPALFLALPSRASRLPSWGVAALLGVVTVSGVAALAGVLARYYEL
jgi:uncharacterized membrane protein